MHLSDTLFVIILVGPVCSKFELPPLLEDELKHDWAMQALLLRQEEVQGKYKQGTFSGKQKMSLSTCCHHFQQFVRLFEFCLLYSTVIISTHKLI